MGSNSSGTDELVADLKSKIQGSEILTASSAGYEESLKRWSDAAIKRAAIVLLAADAEDISHAVLFAQEHKLDLAIRGGGHSVAGTSSSDGGLVIDLSRMRTASVDVDAKTVTAQGGCLWEDVDAAAARHGLATPGGTVNHTGIGGLTLGGGYGWLSSKYGMVVDNLLCMTMVLANGRIVKASATENADLFWAVRGAGHNFGVAVEFTYQAYEQPNEVFCGMVVFAPDKLEAVIDVLNDQLQNPDADAGAFCAFAQTPASPSPVVLVALFYNGPEESARRHFADLFALGPVSDDAKMAPYTTLNSIMNGGTAHGGRRTMGGFSFSVPMRPSIAREAYDAFSEKVQAEPEMAGSILILEFSDLRKICEVPLTDTAFANRGMLRNGVFTVRWESPSKDLEIRGWVRSQQKKFRDELAAHGDSASDTVPQYLNYAEPGESVVSNLYGVNLERLQHLKWKYDPSSVFGKMSPIKAVQPT